LVFADDALSAQAEIDDLDLSLQVVQNIARLDITVHNLVIMYVFEALKNLPQDVLLDGDTILLVLYEALVAYLIEV